MRTAIDVEGTENGLPLYGGTSTVEHVDHNGDSCFRIFIGDTVSAGQDQYDWYATLASGRGNAPTRIDLLVTPEHPAYPVVITALREAVVSANRAEGEGVAKGLRGTRKQITDAMQPVPVVYRRESSGGH